MNELKKRDANWEQHVELFKEFMEEYQRMPKQKEIYKTFNIGRWSYNIKQQYYNDQLSEEKTEQLTSIGFIFEKKHDQVFEQNIERFKDYINTNQSMPKMREIHNNWPIGNWCHNISQKYKKGNLSQERIESLESVGFELF